MIPHVAPHVTPHVMCDTTCDTTCNTTLTPCNSSHATKIAKPSFFLVLFGTAEERLESCVLALEGIVAKNSVGDGDGPPPSAVAWNDFYEASVKPFIATSASIDDCKQIGEWTESAFSHIGKLMAAAPHSAKPSDADFMEWLGPVVTVITAAGSPRSPFEKVGACQDVCACAHPVPSPSISSLPPRLEK